MFEIKFTGTGFDDVKDQISAFIGTVTDYVNNQSPVEVVIQAPQGFIETPVVEVPNLNAPVADRDGLPWDDRIHSSSKALNADGTWRGKRGVSKELVVQVETELKSKVPQGFTETPVTVAAPPVNVVVAPPPVPVSVAAPPTAPVVPVSGPVTPATIVNLISSNSLDVQTVVIPVLTAHGLTALPELFQPKAADMLPSIYTMLGGK